MPRAFHKLISTEHPEVLSGWDVRLGDARATLMAYKRRAAYIWLRRRMGHAR